MGGRLLGWHCHTLPHALVTLKCRVVRRSSFRHVLRSSQSEKCISKFSFFFFLDLFQYVFGFVFDRFVGVVLVFEVSFSPLFFDGLPGFFFGDALFHELQLSYGKRPCGWHASTRHWFEFGGCMSCTKPLFEWIFFEPQSQGWMGTSGGGWRWWHGIHGIPPARHRPTRASQTLRGSPQQIPTATSWPHRHDTCAPTTSLSIPLNFPSLSPSLSAFPLSPSLSTSLPLSVHLSPCQCLSVHLSGWTWETPAPAASTPEHPSPVGPNLLLHGHRPCARERGRSSWRGGLFRFDDRRGSATERKRGTKAETRGTGVHVDGPTDEREIESPGWEGRVETKTNSNEGSRFPPFPMRRGFIKNTSISSSAIGHKTGFTTVVWVTRGPFTSTDRARPSDLARGFFPKSRTSLSTAQVHRASATGEALRPPPPSTRRKVRLSRSARAKRPSDDAKRAQSVDHGRISDHG